MMSRLEAIVIHIRGSCPVISRPEAIAPLGQPSTKLLVWCHTMSHPEAIAPLEQPSAKVLETISPLERGPPLERRQKQSERPNVSRPVMSRMEAMAPLGQPSAKPLVWCNTMSHPEAIAPAIAPLGQPSARPLVWCDTMSHPEAIAPLEQLSAKTLETISPMELGPPLERWQNQSKRPHMSRTVMSHPSVSRPVMSHPEAIAPEAIAPWGKPGAKTLVWCRTMCHPEAIAPLELASLHLSSEHCPPL